MASPAFLPTGTVTFLFTDIEGSTRLWAQHPEAMEAALPRRGALAADLMPQHDGRRPGCLPGVGSAAGGHQIAAGHDH